MHISKRLPDSTDAAGPGIALLRTTDLGQHFPNCSVESSGLLRGDGEFLAEHGKGALGIPTPALVKAAPCVCFT